MQASKKCNPNTNLSVLHQQEPDKTNKDKPTQETLEEEAAQTELSYKKPTEIHIEIKPRFVQEIEQIRLFHKIPKIKIGTIKTTDYQADK